MSDTATATAVSTAPTHPSAWRSSSGFGFRDLVDIINPLQHLPIVSSIYRWATGDEPGEAAKIAGDALYGGPIGIGFGLIGATLEDNSGHDVGERALAWAFGSSDHGATAVAAAAPSPKAAAASPPASAPVEAAATAVAAPAVPDHTPMPLFGGIAQTPPAAAQTASAAPSAAQPNQEAAQQLIDHNATLQREISAGRRPVGTAPVPLVVPAGTLSPPRMATARAAATPAPASRAAMAPAASAAPAAPTPLLPALASSSAVQSPATAAATPDTPIDVSQKMLDALDKYMRLEQERKAPGSGTPPASPGGVDLSL